MNPKLGHKILRGFLWTLLGLVLVIMAIPVLLYIPFVQDFAVKVATTQVAKSTGMKVEIGKLRLGFPLKLHVDDATVIQENGDTMLTSRHLAVDVKLMPLFKGQVDVAGARLDSAFYQMGNRDSVLWLRARIAMADIDGTDINLKNGTIDLSRGEINGANVRLRMLNDTTPTPTDTTPSTPWNIHAGFIRMQDVTYSMEMLPIIDTLDCHIGDATLCEAIVDMARHRINGRSLKIDSVSARYIYPASTGDATATAADSVSSSSAGEMWTITADTLRLTARGALYAQKGVKPAPGFDASYISGSDIEIEIDSFYNRGTSIRVPLKKFTAKERCGLMLYADGLFSMDEKSMKVSDFDIETLKSSLRLSAEMGMGDLMTDANLPLSLKGAGRIDPAEVVMAFPDMRAMLAPMRPLSLEADVDGTSGLLNIYSLNLNMPDIFRLAAQGEVSNPFNPDKIGGEMSLNGRLASVTDRQFSFLPIKSVPALALDGTVDYMPGNVSGDLNVTTRGGELAAAGRWNAKREDYSATLRLDDFPVDAFVPEYGVGRLTANLKVDGKGYNPMSKSTYIDADVNLKSVVYNKEPYQDIILTASLHDGNAKGKLTSLNADANLSADFDAQLDGDSIIWDVTGDLRNLNLYALHLTDTVNNGAMQLSTNGWFNIADNSLDANADISNLKWELPGVKIASPSPISLEVASADSLLRANLANGDLSLKLRSHTSIFTFMDAITAGMNEVNSEVDSMRINVDRLHQAFPRMDMLLEMGRSNVASDYLRDASGINLNRFLASVHNDSLISLNLALNGFASGSTRLDTITFNAIQHGDYLIYRAMVDNRPGTFDDFAHVGLNGFVGFNRLSAFMKQENIKGETGFNIGLSAMLEDSVVTVKLVPLKPTIAYKPWTLNEDNFISFDLMTKHIDANLELTGDKSFVKLFTEHPMMTDSIGEHHHDHATAQEDVVLQISQIHLQDWLSINPFAPPVKGDLSANLRFRYDDNVLTGKGTVGLDDLYYGRDRVGTFGLDVDVANSPGGKLMANVALMVDSVKTITASGVLNDSTAGNPFLLDFQMIHFPLRVVNPFIPQGMASLSGMLNGEMKITGDMAHPIFNGSINFDSTAVKVAMLGTSFSFSDEKIPVDSNIVNFNDFEIFGCNENPLVVNGNVDARALSNIGLDLGLSARNIQVVKSDRARGADIYGKAFLDLDATAKGNMELLNVDANVSLLPATNVTYVLSQSEQTLTSQSTDDMVHFVQFNDTLQMANADSIVSTSMALNLEAQLHLNEGCAINVDLSTNGKNRVHLQPSGDLTYTMSALNGDRVTGRINIDEGFVRYTPPFMSEKNFVFQEGSYVAFNGDMLNPILNIHAVDQMKANVTQSGQNSRLVNFDVALSVTNTLENMNVAFDLSTDDDITVQNELASMSAEQRANQAMNLLLYNVYSGAETKATAKLGGNPLYSFLTSQLNTWAANNIRGVDISFGIDQYDKTYQGSTSTTTSYSYRVSKTLFNDRFKIVVGGNYSTDADTDENFSQNLINDISFEYMLNQSGSMYVKIFRHTGYESILEGEITQTGVGFVLKRKLNSLWELFGIRRD